MGFHVQFYIFEKRVNSTARPVGQEHFALLGNLKEGCGIHNPTIMFSLPADYQDVGNYNYAYIKLWRRFYYIKEWYWEEGAWNCQFVEDPLASWRDEIGELEEYVVRSAQSYNGNIQDNLYPATSTVTKSVIPIVLPNYATDITWDENGCFVLGVVQGKSAVSAGGVTYYAVTATQAARCMRYLLSDQVFEDLPEFLETVIDGTTNNYTETQYLNKDFIKYQFNPVQYITGCYWLPYKPNVGTPQPLYIGYWYTGENANVLTTNMVYMSKTVSVPKHPQSGSRGSYLNCAPYSRYVLNLGQFGYFPLDSVSLSGVGSLDIDFVFDSLSGVAQVTVSASSHTNNYVLLQTEAKVSVEIPVAQITRNYLGSALAVVNGAGGALSDLFSLDVSGAISGAATAIGNLVNAWQPTVTTKGSAGSAAALKLGMCLEAEFLQVVDDDLEHRGRPLCERRKISDLGGYMMVADADVSLPATDEELSQIKAYMEGGFYWQ